jgi:GNAT superfamily N-acetyltransferase
MILAATEADGPQVQDLTARAGVFNRQDVECVAALWDEYLSLGPEACGYNFIVDRDGDRVLGWACYGPREMTSGVFDLYWIAVDPAARRAGVGRRLLEASEAAARRAGGRMLIAETSGTPHNQPTREFYTGMGYAVEATVRDFYRVGDDLAIFIKRF